jgi:hypothetical protein
MKFEANTKVCLMLPWPVNVKNFGFLIVSPKAQKYAHKNDILWILPQVYGEWC